MTNPTDLPRGIVKNNEICAVMPDIGRNIGAGYRYTSYIYRWDEIMRVKLSQWGNSTALRLPVALLEQTDMHSGSTVDVSLGANGCLEIRPILERTTLASLIQNTPKEVALMRAEGWDDLAPVGKES